MQSDAAPSPCPSSALRQSRDLYGHLKRMEHMFAGLEQQALIVNQTPGRRRATDPGRRRATDPGSSLPGSPLLPPPGGWHLSGSAAGSPTLLPAARSPQQHYQQQQHPTSSSLSGPPTRLPPTAERLQQCWHSCSSSAAAAATHVPATAGLGSSTQQAKQLLEGYQRFASWMFQERFCPLRLGLQQQEHQPLGPVAVEAESDLGSALMKQRRQLTQSLDQQQWQQWIQHSAGREVEAGEKQAVPSTPSDGKQQGPQLLDATAVSVVYSSGDSSVESYASEERDEVLYASPGKTICTDPSAELQASEELAAAGDAAARRAVGDTRADAAEVASTLPSSVAQSASFCASQRHVPTPPLLSTALQLMWAPAAGAASGAAGCGAASSSNDGPAAGMACDAAEQLEQPGGVSPNSTGLQPMRLAFEQAAASPAAAPHPEQLPAPEALPEAAAASASIPGHRLAQQEGAVVACTDSPDSVPTPAAAASGQPSVADLAAVAMPVASALAPLAKTALGILAAAVHKPVLCAIAEQPPTTSSRARALLRLKQRRLQQRQEQQSPGGSGGAAAGKPLQLPLPAAEPEAAQPQGCPTTGEGKAPTPQPRAFLRRRSQMVAMQKLPDWNTVRPRTSSRWSGDTGTGASAAAGMLGSPRASTPGVPAPALPARQQQQEQGQQRQPGGVRPVCSATGRRIGSRLGSSSGGTVDGPLWMGGVEAEEAACTFNRTSSRGNAAAAAAGSASAQAGAKQAQQWRQRRPPSSSREQAPAQFGSASGLGAKQQRHQQQQQLSARTTPFAPRPISREGSYWPPEISASAGRQFQHRPQSAGWRPRGTPLYDAASLLPLTLEGLHQASLLGGARCSSSGSTGGFSGTGLHSSSGSTGGFSGTGLHSSSGFEEYLGPGSTWHGRSSTQAVTGGGRAARTQSSEWASAAGNGGHGLAATTAAAAAAAGTDCGPLDDLLSQVDRMLLQVERAIS